MVSPVAREQLKPALLDRLIDDVTSAASELALRRRELDAALTEEQRTVVERLLGREGLSARMVEQELGSAALHDLNPDTRGLVREVAELEERRRGASLRSTAISMGQLRAAVLRDLQRLLNTENAESLLAEEAGESVPIFAGLGYAQASVLNYGIPPLAGRIRTRSDCDLLAKGIAEAVQRYEPRLSEVRVTAEGLSEDAQAPVSGPVTFLIQAELWGYPLPETLQLRTHLDLEEGRARIEAAVERAR